MILIKSASFYFFFNVEQLFSFSLITNLHKIKVANSLLYVSYIA